MPGLKQEMREMFERRNAMEFNERNSLFEDGLLEKIINLTFANLSPYSGKRWQMTVVRAPLLIQKLYRLLEDKRILDSAVVLLVADPCPEMRVGASDGSIDLLLMSLSYAAKYYCIEAFTAKNFNEAALIREFSLDKSCALAAVAGLGTFREKSAPISGRVGFVYSDIVKELPVE